MNGLQHRVDYVMQQIFPLACFFSVESLPSLPWYGNLLYVVALLLALSKDDLQGESWKFPEDEKNTVDCLPFVGRAAV